jgi:ABC-type xylose transport system substrate-binding protein
MRRVLLACCLLVLSAVSGCTSLNPTVIAVLVADRDAQLQQPLDLGALESRVEETCDGCAVEVYDAESDADVQSDQLDQALTASADIVIVDPVDPEQAETLVQRAETVPVIALGTLVPGADWFVGLSEPAPPAEGADSDLEAAREVILRERDIFTFVPAAEMSTKAADVAVGELVGEPLDGAVDNGGVPSWLFEPVEVTVNDLTTVVVARGAITLEELCAGDTAKRCARLGLV